MNPVWKTNPLQLIEKVAQILHETGTKMHVYSNQEPNADEAREWESLTKINRLKYMLAAEAVIKFLEPETK